METSQVATPIAGWYDDPHDPTQIRFWNGSAWTDATQPRPSVPASPPPTAASPTQVETPVPAVAAPPADALPSEPAELSASSLVELNAIRAGHAIGAGDERVKIRTAVIIAALVLVVAIAGAFLLLDGRDDSSSGSGQSGSVEQARTADAQAAEQARTAQTAIETFSTDNDGSYSGATPEDLKGIESTLSDTGSLQVAAGKRTYSVSVTSSTGDMLTIQRGDDGALLYTCSMPGVGICPTSGAWN